MSRKPAVFRASDLQRAIRAAKAGGIEIERVEIDPVTGRIVIFNRGPESEDSGSPLDAWLAKHARSSQGN